MTYYLIYSVAYIFRGYGLYRNTPSLVCIVYTMWCIQCGVYNILNIIWVLERNLSCENKTELFQYIETILSCENEGTFGDFLQYFTAFDKIYPPFDTIPF